MLIILKSMHTPEKEESLIAIDIDKIAKVIPHYNCSTLTYLYLYPQLVDRENICLVNGNFKELVWTLNYVKELSENKHNYFFDGKVLQVLPINVTIKNHNKDNYYNNGGF